LSPPNKSIFAEHQRGYHRSAYRFQREISKAFFSLWRIVPCGRSPAAIDCNKVSEFLNETGQWIKRLIQTTTFGPASQLALCAMN